MNNELLNQDIEKAKVFAAASNAIQQEQLHMNQLLGRIQATQSIAATLDVLSLAQIADIKEHKSYKQLTNQTLVINGEEVRLDTWEGFCRALGTTRQNIERKLDDLQLLGESALEKAQELGMTTRELRKLRKMPSDDQKVVIGEIEAAVGDKDEIIDLIDSMSAKHNKEKDTLTKQLAEEKAERKAVDRMVADKDARINELSKKLARQENASPMDRAVGFAQDIAMIETEAMAVMGRFDKLFQSIAEDADLPTILRINQGKTLLEIKDWCNRLIDDYQLGDVSDSDDPLDWAAQAAAAIQKDGL